MDKKIKSRFGIRAAILKAMAHPTRLMIIEKLSQKERCVGELTLMVGDDVSTVSKHLSILKNIGIVSSEKRGQSVFYRLKMPCAVKFLSCIESAIRERANA